MATELEEPRDLLDADDEAPIIRLVNSLLFQAVKDRASDIHIEPFERELAVRFRIDGILYDIITPPKRFQPVIISRVKIMAGLNIAEKRLPQDGRIRIKIAGKDVDIRVSIIPTAYGERVVMRLLDRAATLLALDELGLDRPATLEIVERADPPEPRHHPGHRPDRQRQDDDALRGAVDRSTPPRRTSSPSRTRSSTSCTGVGQMQVNPKIELTFASGLRSILRQDPDVIMVGEIRDVETAEIAIQAALTGHLVFSTLHTNDACGAVTRLVDMGIEPFLVSSSVIAVMAQRLVRRVCADVPRRRIRPTAEELRRDRHLARIRLEGRHRLSRRPGLPRVQADRLPRPDRHPRAPGRRRRDARPDHEERRRGHDSPRRHRRGHDRRCARTARDKVLEGLTTIEEVLRVTQEDSGRDDCGRAVGVQLDCGELVDVRSLQCDHASLRVRRPERRRQERQRRHRRRQPARAHA